MRFFSDPRILIREITDSGRYKIHAAYTDEEICNYKTVLNVLPYEEYSPFYLLTVLNSALMSWIFPRTSNKVVSDTFPRISVADIERLPIPDVDNSSDELTATAQKIVEDYFENSKQSILSGLNDKSEIGAILSQLGEANTESVKRLNELNTSLKDYLGAYSEDQSLADIGLTQPRSGAVDSILQETSETYPNLRVGTASVVRESSSTVEVQLTARYKPEELAEDVSGPVDDREADQWGYVKTDPETALRITDLTETEANLIEAFVPVAINEAGGFAGFRETATKTNSLVDRLHKLTLPAVSDVETGLKSYMQTKERAEELGAKIEQTDELIDEIVYELYGLTDEEIEIVEEAVKDD